MLPGHVDIPRLRQLAQSVGICLFDLPLKFSLRSQPCLYVTRDDQAVADQLLAQETSKGQKGRTLIKTKKHIEESAFKAATSALGRLVQENGKAEVAQCLLIVGSLDAIKDSKIRKEQYILRSGLLKSAASQENLGLVALFASTATPEQLVDPVIIGLARRNAGLVQLLFESGADPNDFPETVRSTANTGDTFELQLLLRAPKPISPDLINECLGRSVLAGNAFAAALFVQYATLTHINRVSLLQSAFQNGHFNLFIVLLYYTRSMSSNTLSGLISLIVRDVQIEWPIVCAMVEALLCAGAVHLEEEATHAMLVCVERRMIQIAMLLMEYGVPICLAAIQRAVHTADLQLVDMLLPDRTWNPGLASKCVSVIPRHMNEGVRQKLLQKLLVAGATGVALDEELVRAVSLRQGSLIDDLLIRGASPSRESGTALLIAVDTEQIDIVERLLSTSINPGIIDDVFRRLGQVSKPSRRFLSKIFIAKGIPGPSMSLALHNAICDVSDSRDKELIDNLITAGARCDCNGSDCLRSIIDHHDTGLFRRVVRSHHGGTGLAISPAIPPATASSLIKYAIKVSEHRTRNEFMKQLISCGAAGNELAEAFYAFLTCTDADNELLHMFIFESPLNINFNNGEAVVRATTSCLPVVLETILRMPKIVPATISEAVYHAVEHDFPSDKERATRLALLLRDRHQRDTATNALKQQINKYIDNGLNGTCWPLYTLDALLTAEADVNVDSGSCLIAAISAGSLEALKLLLLHNPTKDTIDGALNCVMLLADPAIQFASCEMILAAAKPSALAASQALIQACEQESSVLCKMLLECGAQVGHAEGLCLTHLVSRSNSELLRLLIARTSIDFMVLERLWNEIGPISSDDARSSSLGEILLQAGLCGRPVHEALLDAIRSGDLTLCTLLLGHVSATEYYRTEFATALIRVSSESCPVPAKRTSNQITLLDQALLEAIEAQHENICRILIKHDASVRGGTGKPIRAAVVTGSIPILALLLDSLSETEVLDALDLGLYQAASLWLPNMCEFLLNRYAPRAFGDEEIMRIVTLSADPQLLKIFLDAKPTHLALQAALVATHQLDHATRCTMVRAILAAGLTGEPVDSYLLEVVLCGKTDLPLVEVLLEYGASSDYHEGRAVLEAARIGSEKLLRLLQSKSTREELIGQCFLEAINSGHYNIERLKVVEFLLQKGVGAASVTQGLLRIVRMENIDDCTISIAQLLIRNGADVNHCGGQPLCCACRAGNPNLIRTMLAGHPSKEIKSCAFGYLFRAKATDAQLIECMEALGIPGHSQESDSGLPVLQELLLHRPNSPEVLSKLLSAGCSVAITSEAQSIVHWALMQRSPLISGPCLNVLIKFVGRMDKEDSKAGQSSILLAVQNQRHDVIANLAKYHANVNVSDASRDSALMLASRQGSVELVSSLLAAGAAKNDGSLHEAARELQADVARLLILAGHNPGHKSHLHGGRNVLTEFCVKTPTILLPQESRRPRAILNLLIQTKACNLHEGAGKSPLFLALDNQSPSLILDALLRSFTDRDYLIDTAIYTCDGLCYSPVAYVYQGLTKAPVGQRAGLLKLLKRHGVPDVFYALEGPQPITAIGVPAGIALREEQRKLREERLSRDCEVCGDRPTTLEDVHGAITRRCAHGWENVICGTCLQQYLASKMAPENGFVLENITCWAPECNEILQHHEVRKYATSEKFGQYDQDLLMQVIHAGQTYVECSHVRCKGGGWCEPKTVSYVTCELCKKSTCVACNVPWHRDKICPNGEEAKQKRSEAVEAKKKKKQDAASEAEINRIAKRCPNLSCGAAIQKKSGCDHMTCSRCRSEFCYICTAPYEDIRKSGNKKHKRSCKYYA